MENTKVLLVDDEKLIRDGLKIILNTYDNIQVVGLCENGEVAYHFCKENDVDVILMDIRMPVLNGVEATKKIKSEMPHIKILILTTFNDTEYIYEGLKNGASGYMLKDSAYALIVDSILAAHKGNVVVHQEVANKIIESKSIIKNESVHIDYGLTQKDVNIIILIAEGLSNKEIAERLFLSEGTIKNNVSIILEKLDLRDRTQIAIFAYKNGMAK
ncbi:LuxR family two component transcriptional regulator [Natranaerovirga hydrolytica]|uniref:Stage 0 sporulation protein A homolog n=1 Tax=Natranaerovirga hydrolytica TaxID=680378 RepID=A0A4R1M9X4_9FIRM|nr:response regulator transcription factor [Natranaerovirga hydrolytica]TCK86749.1 LuxR family two component transcriptional regulator [Natranaerovirga hydrolytica]